MSDQFVKSRRFRSFWYNLLFLLFLVWLTISSAVCRMPTEVECDFGVPIFSWFFVFPILSTAKDMLVPFNKAEEFPSVSMDQQWIKL